MSQEQEIKKIAREVQDEFQLPGLAEGVYLEFAIEVAKRYLVRVDPQDRSPDSPLLKRAFR